MVFCMLIISCNCLGVWKKVPKKKDSGCNDRAFFLGICIIYPNGLFNSSCFQVGPWAEDFLSVLVTFPSVAVCVVGSLLYIFECSRGLNLILVYGIIIFVCDAVAVCKDYLVVTCSTFGSTRKDYSRFVANNFNTADH